MQSILRALLPAAALVPAAAFAAPPDEEERAAPDRAAIVVTATRAADPVPAGLVGGSVTLLDAEALERRQTREVAEILRDVPGVAVGRVPGQTQLRLRGAEANHTLVLVDGIEVSDPFAGEFDFGGLIADAAARIEVLRGQQSALHGSDAIGGVIHYVTPTGREAPGLSARVEGGSFATVNAALRYGGVAGAADYALSATLNSSDGPVGARGGRRHLGNDSGALALKANWTPADGVRLGAVVRHARTRADFNQSDPDPASPTFGFQIDTPGSRFENEASYALLRAGFDLSGGRWTHALTAQLADTRRDVFDAAGRSFGSRGERLKASYETTLRIGDGALRQLLTLALDVERERYRNASPQPSFAFTGWRSADTVGIVGQYQLLVGDRTRLAASLRHDRNSRFADPTTWRIEASQSLGTGTRLRAAAGTGVKNPGFYELFGFFDGRYVGNPALKPEKSTGWEVGVEQELADRATFGLTWFDSRLDDEIFTAFPPPAFIATPGNRDTRSRQRGIEAFARLRPGPAWRIDAAYSWLRARENGAAEIRRPAHSASVAVDWRAPDGRGGVTLVSRYVGASRDEAFIVPPFTPVRVRLADYLLVNLAADVTLSARVGLFGRIENLANADYEDVFSFATPGRAFYLGARARF